ncbi:AAA family ATPase [Roseicitreum antarcticum]|uniref:AAA family ATPase n=1 Tax=Roseicitreum antarcticum TaxID=564137 RepID=UPI0016808652|nr:ATP-binding protein [Roseicitreum antarcticum]
MGQFSVTILAVAGSILSGNQQAWKHDGAPWTELSHSILFSGEPGTGKTVIARAIAASAGVPIVESSFGTWQSAGHLGDMLREMRNSFAEAIRQKPSVLFIDEVDAAGSRQGTDKHGANYRRQVINQFLSEIDQLQRAEGVILVGATNHPEALDPAILRRDRFDLHCNLGRPTQPQIRHMLTRAMPDAQEADLNTLARAYSGETPATIDATIRAAKSSARRMARPFTPQMLLSARPDAKPEHNRRIAIHECGHAVVATLLGAVPIRRGNVPTDVEVRYLKGGVALPEP